MRLKKLAIRLGFNMMLLSWILVVILFAKAFFNEQHAVVIFINNFYEMWVEVIVIGLSFFFVPYFVWQSSKVGLIRFFWQRRDRHGKN
jgi:hypothetical protein